MKNSAIILEQLSLDEITQEILAELKVLYSQAYHNEHMYKDLVSDIDSKPEVLQLFLARTEAKTGEIVGARAVESKNHSFVKYHGFAPVHGKRFCVLPQHRSQGIGKLLVEAGKRYCFDELDLKVIFGESNELGALSMYGREGALYLLKSIENTSGRNSPEQNMIFFKEFIANPVFRPYRFPAGEGIQFVYCKDSETEKFFTEHGYISKANLLKQSPSQ